MPNFKLFEQRATPVRTTPMLTIQRDGLISFNKATYDALGAPIAVALYYDEAEKIIALKAIASTSPYAYIVRKQPASESYLISGRAFMSHHNIDTTVARRFEGSKYPGGYVGLNLTDTGTELAPRHRKAKAPAAITVLDTQPTMF